jgi:hypothetical protein
VSANLAALRRAAQEPNVHLAILIHRHDTFEPSQYLLLLAVNALRARGWRISFIRGVDHARADALLADPHPPRACFVHVDLTVIPEPYLALARRFPFAPNLATRDISKRSFSDHLVTRTDTYDGPVIVKTNNNCGGLKEAQLAQTAFPTRALHALHRRLPWPLRSRLAAKSYRIFDSKRSVPALVWLNRALVVERFLPELQEGMYCMRSWVFMGPRESLSIRKARTPIVAVPNVDARAFMEPTKDNLPDEIRRQRADLGFDYGKFDFVISDGRPVLLDANRTPTNQTMTPDERATEANNLADGIECLLAASPTPAPHTAHASAM